MVTEGIVEVAAVGLVLADDGLVPALVVVPVKAFTPEVYTAIELHFLQEVGAGLGAVVGRIQVLVQLVSSMFTRRWSLEKSVSQSPHDCSERLVFEGYRLTPYPKR